MAFEKLTAEHLCIRPTPDRQEVEIFGDVGGSFTLSDVEKIAKNLLDAVKQVRKRKVPPAPPPFMLDKEEFATCDSAAEEHTKGERGCSGPRFNINKHEFYLEHAITLRDWLSKGITYYEENANERRSDSTQPGEHATAD